MTSPYFNTLKSLIESRQAVIAVVGLGYVGLPFAVEKAKVGFHVIGIEQNPIRSDRVNRGENYIGDVDDDELKTIVSSGHLKSYTDFTNISNADVIIICVPTPLTKNLTPDLSYVEGVSQNIAQHLRPGQLISLESTTYPGTTDELIKPILEQSGQFQQGEDFFLAYSPERVDPGNQRYTTKNTNKVVGASDALSLDIASFFYQQTIDHVVTVSSAKAAELVKVFENTFRAVNIALVNELALLCDRLDLNVWEVLDAANTKPFGIMPFYPGPGVGGHCIPIDPHYLEWKAKEVNFTTRFIGLAGEINRQMPFFVRTKACRALNKLGIAPSCSKILILGVAYKKDLPDWRESPALVVIQALLDEQAQVSYHDPYVPEIQLNQQTFQSQPLTIPVLAEQDLVILTTDHSNFDLAIILKFSRAILDTRGALRSLPDPQQKVTFL